MKVKNYTRIIRQVNRPEAVVFDLDATLCDHDEQTNWEDCDQFHPIVPVVELAKMTKAHGYDLVIATARPCKSRDKTLIWLENHLPEWDALYMKYSYVRATASACKEQQLLSIEKRWDILFWVDDSPYNAAVIRDHGVTCFRPTCNDAYWATVERA